MTQRIAARPLRFRRVVRAALSAGTLLLAAGAPLAAQEWRLSAQFGRVSYAGTAAEAAQSSTVSVGASRLGARDWFGASVGVPLEDNPFWGVAGLWRQWRTGGRAGIGLDLSGHAFLQRERSPEETGLPPLPIGGDTLAAARNGEGVGGTLAALAHGAAGPARLELRAGVTAQSSRLAGIAASSALPFSEASLLLTVGPVLAGPEARIWLADSTISYVGLSAYGSAGPAELWASGGRWQGAGPGDITWSAGAALPLGGALRLEGAYRSGSYDPLYATSTSSSLTLGASVRVGGTRGVSAPVPASYRDGRAQIRLPRRAASGPLRIAGDFNGWQPQPMVAEGDHWTFSVQLEPGVYNYAFVDAAGEWFVPEGVPGRRPDGMGGFHAVLVIS